MDLHTPSNAYNVERVREKLLENVVIPPDLLQKAINKLESKLSAKRTQFFPFQGQIMSQVDVEDHAIQLDATHKILQIAGVYAKEREAAITPTTVALEMDATTGVVRLVIGNTPQGRVASSLVELPAHDSSSDLPPLAEPADAIPSSVAFMTPPVEEEHDPEQPKVVKVRQGRLPVGVYNALFNEEDGK